MIVKGGWRCHLEDFIVRLNCFFRSKQSRCVSRTNAPLLNLVHFKKAVLRGLLPTNKVQLTKDLIFFKQRNALASIRYSVLLFFVRKSSIIHLLLSVISIRAEETLRRRQRYFLSKEKKIICQVFQIHIHTINAPTCMYVVLDVRMHWVSFLEIPLPCTSTNFVVICTIIYLFCTRGDGVFAA